MDEAEWREFFVMCQRVEDWIAEHGAQVAQMAVRLGDMIAEQYPQLTQEESEASDE